MSADVTPRSARIIVAGDSALALEIGARSASKLQADVDVNARVIAIARAVRRRAIGGVRDVVATFRSVTVFFDPLLTDVAAVAAALHEDTDATPPESSGRGARAAARHPPSFA